MLEHPAASAAASEAVILSHWDAGASIEQIVAATRYRPERVEKVIGIFHIGPSPAELDARLALPTANAAHAAALIALQRRMASEREHAMARESRRDDQETREINAGLRERIVELCKILLPRGAEAGNEYTAANIHDMGSSSSLSINIGKGAKRGMWIDFANPQLRGQPLGLVAAVACGGDWKEAYAWAREFLGIPDPRAEASSDPEVRARIEAERAERRARMAADQARREQEAVAERARIRASAVARWQEALVLAAGDPVVAYLAARGIDLGQLYAETRQRPGAIRYNPALQYGVSLPGGPAAPKLPAMVGMITALDGTHIATHRTWLDVAKRGKAGPDLIGYDRKGEPNDPKKVLGACWGGHIPVWKGASKAPLKDIPPGTDVFVSEGVEDGLTAACARPDLRVVAAISVGNLAHLELPEQMGRLIILRQNDPPGSDADKAVQAAAAAHRERGRKVGFVRVGQG